MSDRPYLQHGRRHGPNGSDPIPNSGIQFDTDNQGGYLQVTANDSFLDPLLDDADVGVDIADTTGDGAFLLSVTEDGLSYVQVKPESLSLTMDDADSHVEVLLSPSTVRMFIGASELFRLDSDGTVHLKTGATIVSDL